MRLLFLVILLAAVNIAVTAQRVTVTVRDRPAAEVFRTLMSQTGKNFLYAGDILVGLKVTVTARDENLDKVLLRMFKGTGIEFRIKGNTVILRRKKVEVRKKVPKDRRVEPVPLPPDVESIIPHMLEEVEVVSGSGVPASDPPGADRFTAEELRGVPVLLGEADVVKALQAEPGVSEGMEGLAGMYVHGGEADENLFMLDNVPLYDVNHFAGLFSAFNMDAVSHIDFYKSVFPTKYDGRLSSFLDVRTRTGSSPGVHGTARLGLSSGAVSVGGRMADRTMWSLALRRSWYEVLTIPFMALVNQGSDDKSRFSYSFMDFNANVRYRFGDSTTGSLNLYMGNDYLRTGNECREYDGKGSVSEEEYKFRWGNILVSAGAVSRFSPALSAEFTAAFTRYFSQMRKMESEEEHAAGTEQTKIWSRMRTSGNVNDIILRTDFTWRPSEVMTLRYGGGYTFHSFQPLRTRREAELYGLHYTSCDSVGHCPAGEVNAYIENDWCLSGHFRVVTGIHASMFRTGGHGAKGLSPRATICYTPSPVWSLTGAYMRTTQYVHRLTRSCLSLPTDQWIPVSGRFRPEYADKVSAGACWSPLGNGWRISVDAYWKWMHNLLDYRDEYYLQPPLSMWHERLTSGKGSARGIDFKIECGVGSLSGHLAYSLAWSDRTFPEKNGGKTFPARFDNRHTINLLVNWRISDKVTATAAWTGHSGNRITFMPQSWEMPDPYDSDSWGEVPLKAGINNYRLPFYHRLDIGLEVRGKHGYWNFGLYNAYCNMNPIAVIRSDKTKIEYTPQGTSVSHIPVFKTVSLLPLIPSISYTWQF